MGCSLSKGELDVLQQCKEGAGVRSAPPEPEPEPEPEPDRSEAAWAAAIAAEDLTAFGTNEPGSAAAADALHERGVTIEFLLDFTRRHDCWHLPTWKVVYDIVRPATRGSRLRYADLPDVRRSGAVGRADTFVSHSWGALWGVLVSALADRADRHRRVWIDIFAVRQWEGNSADLQYASVVSRCSSFVICCQASPTKQIQGVNCLANLSNSEMLARRIDLVPAPIRAQISFLRAWCLVDVMSAIEAEKKDPRFAIIMKVGNMSSQRSEEGFYAFQVCGCPALRSPFLFPLLPRSISPPHFSWEAHLCSPCGARHCTLPP